MLAVLASIAEPGAHCWASKNHLVSSVINIVVFRSIDAQEFTVNVSW